MEKTAYEKPEMEVIELEDDAILTSGEDCTSKYSTSNMNVSC